ncbi:MAG TPA: DEAD/DEAH box helicase [Ktedonobacterales bacterium]|nr:DEAD/DEAH box helicase [Ktedonobacterales bacterium]
MADARTSQRGKRGQSAAEAARQVDAFASELPFPLDPFQREAALHLAQGRSVLVAAPTGTGKTIVAEFGIWQARQAGQRAIYTAPLKALSNQKFRDLRADYGADQVGLMTGDIVENPTAPIVVMTTEIYRNMLLEGSRAARHPRPAASANAHTPPADVSVAPAAPNDAAAIFPASNDTSASPPDTSVGASGGRPVAAARQSSIFAGAYGSAPSAAVPPPRAAARPRGGEATDPRDFARQAALDDELSSVGCVIFDELHYLSDLERGPVWEEAIIHSPAHVTFVGLSATVSNADQLCQWISQVHGPTALVFHVERAVPLEHYFYLDGKLHLVQNASGRRVERFPGIGGEAKLARDRLRPRSFVFGGDDSAPPLPTTGAARVPAGGHSTGTGNVAPPAGSASQPVGPTAPVRRQAPEAGELLTALRTAGLLPCLYFLPGRRAVEVAAESAAGHLLVSPEQRARVHAEVQQWVRALPVEDQRLDQVRRLAALLPRGLAFHHAGLLPGLKMMVETLFARGDLRAVFATDTLALGINMPARSVILGSLSKFDGTSMRLFTPNEYQQLTGRAGRRGMDQQGAAIIPYSPWDEFEPAFALLTGALLPVISAFTVRYNTVLNLWRLGDDQARLRAAVAASLREFQRRGAASSLPVAAATAPDELPAGRRRRTRAYRAPHASGISRAALRELNATIWVLRHLGYIATDDELTIRGHLLRAFFHPAGMVLTELVLGGSLDDLGPAELAEVVSWFTFDDDRSLRNLDTLAHRMLEVRREVYRVLRIVQGMEYQQGVALSPGVADSFHGIALNWWRGISLGGLLRRVDLAEGDLLVSLNQTIDLLQQVQGAVGQTLDAHHLWTEHADSRRAPAQRRTLEATRASLTRLRSALDTAWRGLLRGSVAQSRAIPAMATAAPLSAEDASPAAPAVARVPLAMAEDADAVEARQDRIEDDRTPASSDADRPVE